MPGSSNNKELSQYQLYTSYFKATPTQIIRCFLANYVDINAGNKREE